MIKAEGKWSVGTYLWNETQTDATLITIGLNKTINWIDEQGKGKVISYHISNERECTSCHQEKKAIIPIGPKIRNWNIDVERNGSMVNQLDYFQDSMLMTPINHALFGVLPNWKNTSSSLEERARAYLEVNCAHCHRKDGFASNTTIYFSYETPLSETRIEQIKEGITDNIARGNMPKLGTTIVDEEGLALMKTYINSLK